MFLSKKPIRLQQHTDTGQELTEISETGYFPVFDWRVSGGSCSRVNVLWFLICFSALIVKRNYYSSYYRLPVSSGHLSLTQTSGKHLVPTTMP